jgi:orotidine-5'-phosphate decarboxylase|tara:strand:- start:2951 stop:3652 length:702 start_codon:yes stop_codon:yes gene_type:complete
MTVKLAPKQAIIALDLDSLDEVSKIISLLNKDLFRLKVGKQLFTSEGPKAIEMLSDLGFEVFLDLKLHDIPNTVSKALKNIHDLGVWMTNIHLMGGKEMISESVEVIKNSKNEMILIGVSVLTSLDKINLSEIGFHKSAEDLVIDLATLGKDCGVDGVVCSINDVSAIKSSFGGDFITVTPGVRMSQANEDQKRSGSIYDAIKFGSDYVVIGRELTKADNPAEVIKKLEALIN